MTRPQRLGIITASLFAITAIAGPSLAAGNPMSLVGAINPWRNGQFSNAAVDVDRHVGFLGSFDDQGVAVLDTSDPSHPVLSDVLTTRITSQTETSDSADLDRQGSYLAVSHQPWTDGGFSGISIYRLVPDAHHPALVRRVALPAGIHTVQLDPDVHSGRPYAYANEFEFGVAEVFIVDITSGAVVGTYTSPEPQGCVPSDDDCQQFNSPHEGWIQRHPDTGRVLDYVAYWDSGMRILDVTDPANPIEVGAYDYPGAPGNCCAHSTAPTPSGDVVYLEDEIG